MRFLILGPLEIHGEQGAVTLGGTKLRGVLAVLLLHANEAVSAERLALALWGQDAPSSATKTVQVHVWRLRKALGDPGVIATTPAGYCLRVRPEDLDAADFERLTQDGRRALADGRPERAARILRQALSLWRGPALAELALEPFAPAEIARLDEQRLAALEVRIEADLECGHHAQLVGELRQLVTVHPARECLAAQLMLALYRCGRQTDALEVYQDARRGLVADAGVEPGPRLRELQQAVLRHDAELEPRGRVTELSVPLDFTGATVLAATGGPRDVTRPIPLSLPRSLSARNPTFVGRETELAWLREQWTQVRQGDRSAIVISGEPGIGKTRLAGELAREVHEQSSLVLYGRCDEGLAVPYQPFVEALRSLLPTIDVDHLCNQLGGLAPGLGRLLPELSCSSAAPADAESARFALFEAVVALLEVMTAGEPTLLVIDDVQWAAPATLLLLRHLIRSERQLALLLIVTFRSTELQPDEPLARLLADLHRDNSADHVSLSGLDEQAIDTLLRVAVGPALAGHATQMVARIHTETAGNPFFVRELVAHLQESDVLHGDGPAAARLPAKLGMSEGLRGVVCHRVARLSQLTRQLITIASVAVGAIDVSLLDPVLPHDGGLLDALDEAVAAGLLVECGRGRFDFAHALVRQAVYDDLSMARRLYLHRRLGEALETRGDAHEHVEALAHHFAQLALDGETDKAIDYAIAAGHAANTRLAYEDAAAHFQRGLDLLAQMQEPDTRRHVDLLLGLGQTSWSTGESDRARDAFKRAADIAYSIGDAAAATDAALGFSGPPFFEVGTTMRPSTDVLLQRALAMLGEQDSALRARLMGRLAAARSYADAQDDHRALAYNALAMARRVQDQRALAEVLATCYWATCGPDDSVLHLQMAHELTRLARETGDLRLLVYGQQWVIGHLLQRGDLDGALKELDDLERTTEPREDRFARWLLRAIRAMLAYLQGQLVPAESLARDALQQWGERPQFAPAAQVFAAQMLPLRREQGRLDEVVERMATLVEHTPEVPAWRCALAHIYAQLGARGRATRELELLGDLSSLPRNALWLMSMTRVATVASWLDDPSRSQEAYELLLPHASVCVVSLAVVCEGSVSRPLGMLATTLDRYEDAEQHFENALEMNARIRSPLWAAHTQYEYARMLRLRGRSGDHDRAHTLLATATVTANALGLHALRTRALLESTSDHDSLRAA